MAYRIIVAEDEALIRLDIVEMLEEENYEVIAQADNGQTAVDLTRQLHPDLVMVDIKMPVRDGLDAAREIVSERLAPVIILTAFSQRDFILRAKDIGAVGYLVKPFSKSDLVPAIEIAIGRYSEMTHLDHEVHHLAEQLETRKVLDRAKGYLMSTGQSVSESEAFKIIQRAAMDRRVTMKAIALEIIEQFSHLDALSAKDAPNQKRHSAKGNKK